MSFNPTNLKTYKLYKKFWETPEPEAGEVDDGLSHRGLAQVNVEGADRLRETALEYELDGTKSAAGEAKIDDDERALMVHLLEHDDYGPAFGPEARPKIYEDFGIDPGEIHPTPVVYRPKKAGDIELPAQVSKRSLVQLQSIELEKLPNAMAKEYSSRTSELGSDDGKLGLGLLRDYTRALWARGEQPRTEQIGHALLDVFAQFDAKATKLGATDFSGAGWSTAQSMVLGANLNRFDTSFPEARLDAKTTSLSMNGAMAEPMKYMDAMRTAMNLEPGAEALELASPVAYIAGQQVGHKKRGNLTESKAFSTSGINWGTLLFPTNSEIAEIPPQDGFDFPIDCIDALGNVISARPDHGDTIEVFDKDGNALSLEPVIHDGEDGKSWTAKFTNASGDEVPVSEVGMGRVRSGQTGELKGDGEVGGSLNMWWWGFCDRNTAQKLYKSKFQIPELDREVIKIKAGDGIIEVPREAAQKLVDADVPDLVTGDSFCGFRFNDEPQYVVLKNGQQHRGYIEGIALEAGPGVSRIQQDLVAVHDAPERPMLGNIEVETDGGKKYIDVRNIDRIEKDGDSATIYTKEGTPQSVTGSVATKVPWDKAETVDGKQVLKQTDNHQIRGGFTVKTSQGIKRFDASDVTAIAGETTDDLRISQFMTWVSNNQGMYAQDASPKIVVSNGPRWINKLDVREETGDDRPSFIPEGELKGLQGPLERQDGDKMLFVRGLYAYGDSEVPKSSQFEGWVQVDDAGRILNESFTKGQPDFGWSASGPLDWFAKSSFNEFVIPEMRLAMFVNGVSNLDDAAAKRLNLPSNWKTFLVDQS